MYPRVVPRICPPLILVMSWRSSRVPERQRVQASSQASTSIRESVSVRSKSTGKRKRGDDDGVEDKNKGSEAPPSGSQGSPTPHRPRRSSRDKHRRRQPSSQPSTSMQDDDDGDEDEVVPSKTHEDLMAEKYLQQVTVALFLFFQESMLRLTRTGLGPSCAYRFHHGLLACGFVGTNWCSPASSYTPTSFTPIPARTQATVNFTSAFSSRLVPYFLHLTPRHLTHGNEVPTVRFMTAASITPSGAADKLFICREI
jgi:hypothetical protein